MQVILNMYESHAIVLMKLKIYDEAIRYAKKAIEIARINLIHDRSLDSWTTLANIYIEIGDFKQAEICLLTAIELHNHVQQKHLLINTYSLLGRLYIKQNRLDEAINFLNKAIEIGKETSNMNRLILSLIILADCYLIQENHEEACNVLEYAKQIAEKYKFNKYLKTIILKLAQCYEKKDRIIYNNLIETLFKLEVQLQIKN